MIKWGGLISTILCCFFLFTLMGCNISDKSSSSDDSYMAVTPSRSAADIPTDTPVHSLTEVPAVSPTNSATEVPTNSPVYTPANTPTNTPTDSPTDIAIALPTGVPMTSPVITSPPVTGAVEEETLDDLSAFLPLEDCFLDYAFEVEELGTQDHRTSYMVKGKYDLNSDGREDSITILQKGRNNNLSYIEINQMKLSFNMDNPYDGEVHILDLDKNDRYLEVANFDEGPSGDPAFTFFRYDGSSVYELGSIDAYASMDGNGKLISSFHRYNYFKPSFCSAWYQIIDNTMVRKNNNIDRYLGQMYDFSGGEAYFLPFEVLPDHPEIQWDEMKHFDKCKVKLIDIWGLNEEERTLNYYFIELPTGEKGLIYFWIGD